MLKILCLCICTCVLACVPSHDLVAEDSPLARRMAAEIVEQAAQDNKAYREVLLDVGKALRSKDISVSQAKDLLSLAASCRQLGATRQVADNAAQDFSDSLSGKPKTKPNAHTPEMLDIDKLIDEEKVASMTKEDPLFEDLKKDGENSGNKDESPAASGGGYHTGLAGRKLPWQDKKELRKAHDANKADKKRADLTEPSTAAVTEKMLKRASKNTKGKVQMMKPGMDGLPQHILVNFGAKDGIKDKQELIVSRDGQPLVKAVVIRLKDLEAFAVVMNDTWAAGAEKEIKIGDTVNEY